MEIKELRKKYISLHTELFDATMKLHQDQSNHLNQLQRIQILINQLVTVNVKLIINLQKENLNAQTNGTE